MGSMLICINYRLIYGVYFDFNFSKFCVATGTIGYAISYY